MSYKSPPMVCHKGRPKSFQAMAADACKNVRLSKRGTALFMFYASCSRGFRPALSIINNQTGIDPPHISHVRSELVAKGMIGYGDEFGNCVYIDWYRIRALAMLEAPLQYEKSSPERYFSPVAKTPVAHSTRTIGELGSVYRIIHPRTLTARENRFYDAIDKMTEREYVEMVKSLPEYHRTQFRPLLSEKAYLKRYGLASGLSQRLASQHTASNADIAYLQSMPQELPF